MMMLMNLVAWWCMGTLLVVIMFIIPVLATVFQKVWVFQPCNFNEHSPRAQKGMRHIDKNYIWLLCTMHTYAIKSVTCNCNLWLFVRRTANMKNFDLNMAPDDRNSDCVCLDNSETIGRSIQVTTANSAENTRAQAWKKRCVQEFKTSSYFNLQHYFTWQKIVVFAVIQKVLVRSSDHISMVSQVHYSKQL